MDAQMSTPSSPARVASSFTRAMFTCRYVFSISFAISASRGEEVVTTVCTNEE